MSKSATFGVQTTSKWPVVTKGRLESSRPHRKLAGIQGLALQAAEERAHSSPVRRHARVLGPEVSLHKLVLAVAVDDPQRPLQLHARHWLLRGTGCTGCFVVGGRGVEGVDPSGVVVQQPGRAVAGFQRLTLCAGGKAGGVTQGKQSALDVTGSKLLHSTAHAAHTIMLTAAYSPPPPSHLDPQEQVMLTTACHSMHC